MMGVNDRPPRAWVLNLDAEHELAVGRGYTPTRRIAAVVARERRRLVGLLVAPGDVVLDDPVLDDVPAACRGFAGMAWSPTPRALSRLAAAGAVVAASPPVAVLRAVNERAFAAAVRAPLAGESFAKDVAVTLEQTLALLARPAEGGWLVRRAFGAAGRGRRRLPAGRPADTDRAWIAAGLRQGPLLVEPWVQVTREYTRCGWVRRDGTVVVAAPCFQATTPQGAWVHSERVGRGEIDRADDAVLAATVEATGAALWRAGYFGPFGIDAFRHRPPGKVHAPDVLNPMSEINARYTMDWSLPVEPPAG